MEYVIAFLCLALAATITWSIALYQRQKNTIREVQREKVKVQAEERRVFDFLHNIGEALTHETRPGDLHKSIVEGAMRTMEAQGGALYLADKTGTQLRPAFISKNCPPFVELPPLHGIAQTTLHNQLRLQAVKADSGLLGQTLSGKDTIFLGEGDERLPTAWAKAVASLPPNSAFLAPLNYSGQQLGVLVIARTGEDAPFGPEHLHTFRALAEQSAFSLWDAILHHEAAEKKIIEKDLSLANEVQRVLLPSVPPELPGYELAGTNLPARFLSGDYFDYLPIDDGRCGVAIADVSGKGIPAALLMAMCRSALRLLAPGGTSPAEVLRRLNAQLYPDIKEDMFISMAYAILNQQDGAVQLSRAGHDAPLLWRAADGHVEMIKPPGMAVGVDNGDSFNRVTQDFSLSLEPGDCLVLYTDGVTEALNRNGDEFGMEALTSAVRASAPQGASAIVQQVTADLRNFIGDHPQHDDITLIAIRKK